MSTRQISDTIEEVYGFEVFDSFVSDVTDKILPQIQEWQTRPLEEVYPVVFIDATHYSVRDNGVVRKLATYVILAINCDGRKEVLSIEIGENESAKYWLSVLNSLKNRGLKDILILCADGLTGLKDAVATAFPQTEFQRCIVHQVRNTLKDEPTAARIRDDVALKWAKKYPHAMKSWRTNWDAIVPIFKFSPTLCTIVYTTNAIESFNATYRQLNRQRSVLSNDTALLKALFLATELATKKWTMPLQNWGLIYGELSIIFEGRLPF